MLKQDIAAKVIEGDLEIPAVGVAAHSVRLGLREVASQIVTLGIEAPADALMAKATHEITKSRSRGTGTPVLVRLQPPFVERIDKWRAAQRDLPSRAEAMRRLAEIGLGTGSKRG